MTDARTALAAWDLTEPRVAAEMRRENHVFHVEAKEGAFALRLHRAGLRTLSELTSELGWMAALSDAGLPVPSPRPTRNGALIADAGAGRASLLTWRPGSPMEATAPPEIYRFLGDALARLHAAADAWTPPAGFDRPAWNAAGLVGEAPLWGRFWEAPFLDAEARALMERLRDAAAADLSGIDADYGLIHADALSDNVLVDGGAVTLIDFDDSGWGWRLFDIATSLVKHRDLPGYEAREAALIAGYRALRPLDAARLPLFIALRAATYLGWGTARLNEPGVRDRVPRNIRAACDAADRYFETRPMETAP